MSRLTGGEAIVDGLLRHGIDTVFGLPGVQTYGLFDAFARASNRLRLIMQGTNRPPRHMALGHARTGRVFGIFVVLVPAC
jgi:acetolactate synthase-1/2/3 large subunit